MRIFDILADMNAQVRFENDLVSVCVYVCVFMYVCMYVCNQCYIFCIYIVYMCVGILGGWQ